jgi:hypothetical protein
MSVGSKKKPESNSMSYIEKFPVTFKIEYMVYRLLIILVRKFNLEFKYILKILATLG